MRALIVPLLLFVFHCIPVSAENIHGKDVRNIFRFSHLSAVDGLVGQRVFSIVEGNDHAIWIAGKNGIGRYNGVTMQQYDIEHNIKSYSEQTSRIVKLYKSKTGDLYAFTNSGKIYSYDIVSNSFVPRYDLTNLFPQEIILNDIAIVGDKYWFALNTGLYSCRRGGKPVAVIRKAYINDLMETREGIFVGANNGLYYTGFAKPEARLLFSGMQVMSSYYDKANQKIFIGTFNKGVLLGDIGTRKLQPESPDIPHKPVRAITPFNRQIMLVGVDGGGVIGIVRRTGKVAFNLSTDDETGAALHGNGVYDICCDEWGNIWMGSYSGGVDIAYAVDNTIKVVSHEYLNPQSLFNNNVNDIMDDGHGNVYYATDRGVSIYNASSETWRHTMTDMVCLNLARDINGRIIVATYGGGVRTIDGNAVYTKENGKLKTNYVFSLYNDGKGNLLTGCLDGDLACISASGQRFLPIQNVQSITSMPDGRIAVATANGFHAIDSKGRESHYFTAGEFPSRDVNVYVMSMLFTSANEVWLGTDGGGVYIYNMRLHSFRQLTVNDGLPSNSVKGIVRDRSGRIWVTTDRGIACVTTKPNAKLSALTIPHRGDVEFNRDATAMLPDGRIAFGSTSGAVFLNTKAIKDIDYKAPIRLYDITVSGLGSEEASKLRPHVYSMLSKGKVTLPYSQNTFTLTFESINLKYQYDIIYQYYIEGQQDSALQTVNDGRIAFNSLSPGNYRLHLRSVSRGTGRVICERVLDMQIRQPWWNTLWAWLTYVSIAAVLAYYAWRFYRNRLQREYDAERINFFVNTAHDIRTPLSLTLAPLDDMARDKTLSESARAYLDIARENGRQLMTLISTLLDFQKIDTGKVQLRVMQLDLRELLTNACSRFKLLGEQKHIKLSLVSCPEGATVWMDGKAADSILDNLISNAIKYSHENGKVDIGAKADDSHVIIYVRDNGIGIPEKSREQIFSTFYRAENAVRSKVTGSGLGLMLVKKLVEMHKGTVTFESKDGEGAAFFVTLPKGFCLHPDQSSGTSARTTSHPRAAAPGQSCSPSRPVILFVDDNAELRRYVKLAFGNEYDVVTEPDARSALDYLADSTCDIIISDVMMPGMQGDELCRKVKENAATSFIPVFLLTAKVGRDYAIEGLNCGADDYISKPFDTEVLRAKIASMLRNRQAVRDYYLSRAAGLAHGVPEEESDDKAPALMENKATAEPASVKLDEEDKMFIDKATHIVMENMHDENFDINRLCREMAMSRTLFYSRLKALTGQTPQDFLRMLRLERAAKLLGEGKNVFEASTDTGFANTKYFSTLFKKHFGVSPSKYR